MSRARNLAKYLGAEQRYGAEIKEALSLQAKAWRQVALIGLVDSKRGAGLARMLFFQTVPFVNGSFVAKLVADTEAEAKVAGIRSGVFDK